MFIYLNKKSGQTLLEYTVLLGLVVAAVIAMQVWVRRGLQGRVRDAVDHTGKGGTVGGTEFAFTGEQFEPGYTTSAYDSTGTSTDRETLSTGGAVDRASSSSSEARKDTTIGW